MEIISIGIRVQVESNAFTLCKFDNNLFIDCVSPNGFIDEEKRVEITKENKYLYGFFADMLKNSEDLLDNGRLVMSSEGFTDEEQPSALILEFDKDKETFILSFKKGTYKNGINTYNVQFKNVDSSDKLPFVQSLNELYNGILDKNYQERQNSGTPRTMLKPYESKA